MSKVSTAIKLLTNNRDAFCLSLVKKFKSFLSDKMYLKFIYRYNMGRPLNLKCPGTFNEKLNWLKLYDYNPLYTTLVDKYSVKQWVADKIGSEYVIPTLGVWHKPEEIDYDLLPDQFVLKTTHGGGNEGVVICKDKLSFDKNHALKVLNQSLSTDLYKNSREWPYKNVPRRIIAEEYMEDKKTGELRDYKFFCFNGEVKAMFVGSERQKRKEPYFDFFDAEYNHLDIKQGHPNSTNLPDKPDCFSEMKEIASKLSLGIPHVRVDLYEVNGKVYFGEMTFYHFGGVVPFEPEDWDHTFGSWIKLPQNL